MTASSGPALRDLHHRYGDRVAFLSLYVREAHPGEHYPQPHTLERKIRHARAYRRRDRIRWTVAVDTVDGALHRALDGKPHSAYFVDRDGTVAGRLLWANDTALLEEALAAAAAGRADEIGQRETKLAPMVRGLGTTADVLRLAGPRARDEFRRAVPPVWWLAELAALFRPLSPLGRGIAAIATLAGGLLLAGWAGRRLLRG